MISRSQLGNLDKASLWLVLLDGYSPGGDHVQGVSLFSQIEYLLPRRIAPDYKILDQGRRSSSGTERKMGTALRNINFSIAVSIGIPSVRYLSAA